MSAPELTNMILAVNATITAIGVLLTLLNRMRLGRMDVTMRSVKEQTDGLTQTLIDDAKAAGAQSAVIARNEGMIAGVAKEKRESQIIKTRPQ